MAKVIPFRAVRPTNDKVHLVVSRSVVQYSRRILTAKLETNPYSFLHIVKPEFFDKKKSKQNSIELFQKVRAKYDEFLDEGILIKEDIPALYVYRQIKPEATYTGIIGGISIDDYIEGKVKIHEQTLTKREKIFEQYLNICDFNAEPVLLTYPDNQGIKNLISIVVHDRPLFDYSTTDRIRHQLWQITDTEIIRQLSLHFDGIESVYIADGHHRSASSALLGQHKREYTKSDGNEGFNYILSYFIPESQLDIYDFNRLVKDLNKLSEEEFMAKLSVNFNVEKMGSKFSPSKLHEFSMYLNENWYKLNLKNAADKLSDPVDRLDSSILTKYVLDPILGINDLKTSTRVYFMGGLKGMEGLQRDVDKKKAKVAFGLFPVSIKQLKEIADTNNIMPPKTTWIEPKLRSGLTIFELS